MFVVVFLIIAPPPFEKCAARVLFCVPVGLMLRLPTASPYGHWGDIMTERQLAAVLVCCCGGLSVVVCGTREFGRYYVYPSIGSASA